MAIKRPMKAATLCFIDGKLHAKKGSKYVPFEEGDIPFPVYGLPKIDGIRCLMVKGKALTAQFKPVPNRSLKWLVMLPDGCDGELKVPGKFNKTSSAVMSHKGDCSKVIYHIFDDCKQPESFQNRYVLGNKYDLQKVKFVKYVLLHNTKQLLAYEKKCLKDGYEGIMLRRGDALYKQGRSTLREFGLVKLVRVLSSEARVIGFKQYEKNENEAKTNELGLTSRSKKKAGMKKIPLLGSFIAEDVKTGVVFNCSGFTAKQKADFWKRREKLKGKIFTYWYKPYGVKDAPRQGRFKDWRKGY